MPIERRHFGLAIIWTLVPTFALAQSGRIDREELTETVLGALAANTQKLGMIQLTMNFETTQVDIDKPGLIVEKRPNGSTFESYRAPRTREIYRVVFDPVNIRIEVLNLAGEVIDVQCRKNEQWTQYSSTHKAAWIRDPEQMTSVLQFCDPREIGAPDRPETYSGALREHRVTNGELTRDHKQREIWRVLTADKHEQAFLFDFDPALGLVPVRSIRYCEDHSINVITELAFERVDQRNAWLVSKGSIRYYRPGALYDPALESKARPFATRVFTVRDVRLLQEDSPESYFDVSIPDGTRVHNAISGKVFYQGAASPPARIHRSRSWMIAGNVAILAGLVILIIRRKLVRAP
jgi:hypothetical protein